MAFERRVSTKWTTCEENRLLEYRKEGLTYSQISEKMGRSISSLKHKYVRLNQASNKDEYHHPKEKSMQAEEVLNGKEGLSILETNSGFGNMTNIYSKYGRVEAQDIDKDKVRALKESTSETVEVKKCDSFKEMYNQVFQGKIYDVVDLDPYGFPSRFFPHVFNLIEDGFLFVTFPKMGVQQINKIMIKHHEVFWGLSLEDKDNQEDLIHDRMAEYAFKSFRSVELIDSIDLGRVYRFAYRVKKESALDLVGLKVKGVNY